MKMGLATGNREIAEKLNELLFEVFFVDNSNLADSSILVEAGKKAGLKEEEIQAMLESDKSAAEVEADEQDAARLRIRGVPYFYLKMVR